jgi:outer membrane receptor protein involved in Fe transport
MKRVTTVLFFLLFLSTYILGGTVGRIQGKVTDLQTGEPLIGANVVVVGTNFGAATDVNGEFTIENLDPGVYDVKASYIGYQTVTTSNVRISADLTTTLNFQLPAQGVQVGEVHVVAQRPLVNASNTNAIRVTTNEQIEALPIRGIDNIAALTPGVVQQEGNLYIRGGRQDEVGYYLEGANITNPRAGIGNNSEQVTIPQDAVEEIQVQAGGYTAEFGGSNAGIIRTQLKSGGPQLKASLQYITDNWTFKSTQDRFNGVQNLGTYSYGYNDITGSISGPILGDHIKFFGMIENTAQADRDPTYGYNGFNFGTVIDDITPGDTVHNLNYPGGPIEGNSSYLYTGAATLTFDYNPTIVRLIGTFSYDEERTGASLFTMFDNNRLPISRNYNGDFGFKVTQVLNADAYVEVNASYIFNQGKTDDPQLGDNFVAYGDSVANAEAGVPWPRRAYEKQLGRYITPLSYQLFSTFNFASPNQPLLSSNGFNKFQNDNLDLNAAFSDQVNKQNSLKIGGEIQMMEIRNYTPTANGENLASQMSANPNESLQELLVLDGVNNYGYDLLGNTYNGSNNYTTGAMAPHKPIFAGAYVEDRLQYKNLIVNAGLRYDYINTDNYTFKDPTRPDLAYNVTTLMVSDPSQWVKVPSYSSISPRLGFSFPITDQTVFHAQYGKFVQQPSLSTLYASPYLIGFNINPNSGFFIFTPFGGNLRPTRTTQYEIGFTQQIGSVASVDLTAYYKDISNQVVFAQQNVNTSTGWRPYQTLTNGDYATTQGVEVLFEMRRTQGFLVNASVSFQNAEGTGDNPYSDAAEFGAAIQNVLYIPQYIEPLSFNHALSGNLNVDYHFGKDDGPAILHEFGASLLLTFSSGHPYTLGTAKTPGTSDPAEEAGIVDTRNRFAIEPLNSSVTPSTFQLDLNIDKNIEFTDNLSADIFIQVINLLNTQNVEDVYSSTGSAATDGYLTNPNLTGYKQTQTYGSQYAALYQAVNLEYNGLYGEPRQIRLGIRLDY